MDNHGKRSFGDVQEVDRLAAAQLRAERLAEVSMRVREESMRVNAEFAAIERDPVPDPQFGQPQTAYLALSPEGERQ